MSVDVRVGTSGWFYGEISKLKSLRYIGKLLNAVEVNTTFYGRLSRWGRFAKKWGQTVKDDFHFALKAYSGITHDSRFKPAGSRRPLSRDKIRFYDEMIRGCSLIGPKARVLLFQLPPFFRYNEDNVATFADFFESVKRVDGIEIAVEFRSEGWFSEENLKAIRKLFRDLNLIYVVVSSPLVHLEPVELSKDGVAYIRLHGFTGWYVTDYLIEKSPWRPELPAILDVLQTMMTLERMGARRVYAFWDNTDIVTPDGIYYYPHVEHALALNFVWSGAKTAREGLRELLETIAKHYTGEISKASSEAIERDLKVVDGMAEMFKKLRES